MKNTPTKLILTHYYTKRCTYGNVYHVVRVENVKNGKSFLADTPSLSNVTSILFDAFGKDWEKCKYIVSEQCTNSARISSLPESLFLDPCNFEDRKDSVYKLSWKKELNKIGFRLPKPTTKKG